MRLHLYTKLFVIYAFSINVLCASFEKEFQTKLILASPGEIITIPKGFQDILSTLSIEGKNNITIRGMGIDLSILSFANQDNGAEGLRIINCSNIKLENFTVQNSKGDGIKVQDTDGITFQNIKTEWTNGPNSNNGAYGIYPVECTNVLIDRCIAVGASDAGIYVGQSKEIIVKNNEAYHNVAGIEIENSINADVFDNYAHDNTGGILIFDLPDLLVKKGGNVRVFNNKVENNNLDNFAPKGNIVGFVPAGTGIMVLATSDIEIFNNKIFNNKTVGTAIVSYFMTELNITDTLYNPYTSAIHIHDNIYKSKKQLPTLKHDIGKLFFLKFGRNIPDIIYDGMADPQFKDDNKLTYSNKKLCIQDNKNAEFLNLQIDINFEKWYTPFFTRFSRDKSVFDCELNSLNEVVLNK